MQGQWQTSIAGPSGLPDYLGGAVNIPDNLETHGSDLGIGFCFFPDGRYQHAWMYSMRYLYSCIRVLKWYEEGAVNIQGSSYTFRPAKATFSSADSCTGTTSEERAYANTVTVNITPEQDHTGWPVLRFGYASGDLLLEKCRTCK